MRVTFERMQELFEETLNSYMEIKLSKMFKEDMNEDKAYDVVDEEVRIMLGLTSKELDEILHGEIERSDI